MGDASLPVVLALQSSPNMFWLWVFKGPGDLLHKSVALPLRYAH